MVNKIQIIAHSVNTITTVLHPDYVSAKTGINFSDNYITNEERFLFVVLVAISMFGIIVLLHYLHNVYRRLKYKRDQNQR